MKHKFIIYIIPTTILFLVISIFWVIFGVKNIELLYLALGLIIGMSIIDSDHFIFWFFLKPKNEESKLVKLAIKNKNIKSITKIVQSSHRVHHNLVFHHYFFQVILVLFSLFILTSTQNTIISAIVIGLNLHLVIDEIIDYRHDPKVLQKWLFAREAKQLPISFLKRYITIFLVFILVFTFLLIRSKI
jgi:hypothetical protein